MFSYHAILLLLCFSFFSTKNEASVRNEPVKFFLDCNDCDFNLTRQELPFISFVRSPQLADVHILSSKSETGNRGNKFFLNFIGMNDFEGIDAEYEYISGQSATDYETRNGLLNLIKAGILHYYSIHGQLNNIEINLVQTEPASEVAPASDPWKLWVFNVDMGSDFRKEERQNEYVLNTQIEIEKVTSAWKTRFHFNYRTERKNYFNDGEKFQTSRTKPVLEEITSRV